MSKTVTYKCNLCNTLKSPTELYCIYWDSTKVVPQEFDKPPKYGGYVLDTNINKSDNHLCSECYKMIKESEKPKL